MNDLYEDLLNTLEMRSYPDCKKEAKRLFAIYDRLEIERDEARVKAEMAEVACDRIAKERDTALAACAEMRAELNAAMDTLGEVAAYGSCDCNIPLGETCVPCEAGIFLNRARSILASTDCGKGWHSPEEWAALEKERDLLKCRIFRLERENRELAQLLNDNDIQFITGEGE